MSLLPPDLILDFLTPEEVPAAHAIEAAEFPADEAATLEQFRMRQELAPSLFLGAFLPPSSSEINRTIIGYVCATRSDHSVLTEASMKTHDPEGPSVCIHAVVVASQYKRRGIAVALLKEFASRTRSDKSLKRLLLICHDEMRALYEKAGFEYVGLSPVVHGALPWHEMRLVLNNPQDDEKDLVTKPTSSPNPIDAPSESIPAGLFEALQQSSSSRTRPSSRPLASFSGGVLDVSTDSGDFKTNKYDILCPRTGCGSIILKSGAGRLVEKELLELEPAEQPPLALLSSLPPEGTRVSCWLVQPSPMVFENIGFSRPVDKGSSTQGSQQKLKLLSCADCDLGPLGWCVEGGHEFWLVCTRVGYKA